MKNTIALLLAFSALTTFALADTKPATCDQNWNVRQDAEMASWKKRETAEAVAWKIYHEAERTSLLNLRGLNKNAYLDWLDANEIEDSVNAEKMADTIPEVKKYAEEKEVARTVRETAYTEIRKVYEAEQLAARHSYEDAELACSG